MPKDLLKDWILLMHTLKMHKLNKKSTFTKQILNQGIWSFLQCKAIINPTQAWSKLTSLHHSAWGELHRKIDAKHHQLKSWKLCMICTACVSLRFSNKQIENWDASFHRFNKIEWRSTSSIITNMHNYRQCNIKIFQCKHNQYATSGLVERLKLQRILEC